MEKLLEILSSLYPDIDFEKEKHLMDDHILDSAAVVSIISEIEDEFDISVSMEYIQPKYFESAETMWKMIEELE